MERPVVAEALIGAMVLTGLLITVLTWLVMVPLSFSTLLFRKSWLRWIMVAGAAVPSVITIAGWVAREFSRQPWFIVGRVRIEEAASPIGELPLLLASIAFTALPTAAVIAAFIVFRRIAVAGTPAVQA